MRLKLLFVLLAGTVLTAPVHAGETVLRCTDEVEGTVSRRICAPVPITDSFKVPLPDMPPQPVTDAGKGLEFTIFLPEPPEALVVIPQKDLASLVPAPLPAFPVLAVVPPQPPAPPAVPALAVVAPPTAPAPTALAPDSPAPIAAPSAVEAVPAMPVEVLEAAIKRLKTGRRISEREADEALAFYAARNFQPVWLDGAGWNTRAQAARRAFFASGDDGMDPARYRSVAQFIPVGEPQWPALAAAEAQMTESVILFAREAATGRVRPGDVHPLITPRLEHDKAQEVLAAVAQSDDVAATLVAYQPPHLAFKALRIALAEARANRPAVAAGEPIPDGPPLRVGMRDPRVPLIRARLGLGYDSTSVYDREVSVKVAGLQKANGLPVTGAFTAQTRRVLAGEAPTPEEAEIIANMEFWRWMPRDLGDEHILVNTPAYEMILQRDGRVIHKARTIVGKPETQTPFFSDEMDHIVVNPSWYIPPGILKREPKYLDPGYAAARGYEIRTRGSITTVRVPPGSSNALGYVKFMFPNEHAVYLHDTPNRSLFGARNRTLSNGCVRVENPMQLAGMLFESQGFSEERFRRMQGGGERRMNLPRKLPVHLAYFTVTVGPDGGLIRHPDVYGHTLRLRQLLGLS